MSWVLCGGSREGLTTQATHDSPRHLVIDVARNRMVQPKLPRFTTCRDMSGTCRGHVGDMMGTCWGHDGDIAN